MGTETNISYLRNVSYKNMVKKNNPPMGTETYRSRVSFHQVVTVMLKKIIPRWGRKLVFSFNLNVLRAVLG